ncbi:hypothetical protein [Streptomyces rimosus]|uniref:hypothetical protein n=1 Tax=Streptomyces rimosus TaxID=1927 RepID=UPI0037D4C43F
MTEPTSKRAGRIGMLGIALTALLVTGGCMNDGGKNDPLPVKSRGQAEHLVRSLVDSLAGEYDLKVDGKTVHASSGTATERMVSPPLTAVSI